MSDMAVATPTLSSRQDSGLQNSSSPYLLSGNQHHGGSFSVGFVDRSLIAALPPGLLPSGTINLPDYFPQLEQFKMSSRGTMQPLSTPVMHPNLVSTLKSIISPPPTSFDQPGKAVLTGVVKEVGRHELRRTLDICSPSNGGHSEHADVCSIPSSNQNQELSHVEEDDEAAVVPVDLIQNRRPFKCAYSGCNKTFKNPQTMKMHHKTHYSDDSAYRLGVNAHVLSTLPSSFKAGHNKKIPSRCPICKKTFVGLYELRRHFGRKHSEGEKTFACKKCGKKFYIEVDLRDHEKLCGEPIECRCGMKFAFKCNLVAHKKGHPECQDLSPSEEEQGPASLLPVKESSRQASPAVVTSLHLPSVSVQSSVMLLPPLWNTRSPSQDASGLGGFAGNSTMSVSSDLSYQSVEVVTSTVVTALSSRSSGVMRPNYMS